MLKKIIFKLFIVLILIKGNFHEFALQKCQFSREENKMNAKYKGKNNSNIELKFIYQVTCN